MMDLVTVSNGGIKQEMPERFLTLEMDSLGGIIASQLVSIIHPIHVMIIHINECGDIQYFYALFSKYGARSTCICGCFCWSAAET